ncbi:MAG: T9SS type A sorting domain-containing protein, partial [Planctomycetes bacterium]|nr:T9SS type A sorting domain-containing protein [Planctomycetota bacterium]
YVLKSNYPNPFNPETTIEFSLPQSAEVTLVIYNILGEKVEILLNSQQSAGYHKVRWNASNVSSGIYFYRLQAGIFVETRKMMLLK